MSAEVYEVLALALRYWFAALGVLIVWRAFAWLRRDRAAKHRMLRTLPDAGMIGELVVEAGSRDLQEGMVLAVPWEGVLGSVRTCDLCVPVGGVAREHLRFSFDEKTGLRIIPCYRQMCGVNGKAVTWRSVRRHPEALTHGSVLTVGDAQLRLRVFLGLAEGMRPRFAEERPEETQAMHIGADGAPVRSGDLPQTKHVTGLDGVQYGAEALPEQPVRRRRSRRGEEGEP
ncbi:MAG: FHA domain-containing protein [Clostridia bacterium]|nr:FHA domain-containing protein [Clostridia bacterium]